MVHLERIHEHMQRGLATSFRKLESLPGIASRSHHQFLLRVKHKLSLGIYVARGGSSRVKGLN